ncbi:MAG: glycogen debranching enzyme family protein [Armatimonadetes bacterium]|nr:glycogen debranching enzyme family protein [Armatimonadota bacterium]
MAYTVPADVCRDFSRSSALEWMLPNGRGGYAMGTVSGAATRRYHGHLVAAVAPPAQRMVLLVNIEAYVTHKGESVGISTNQYVGAVHPLGYQRLTQFSVGDSVVWEWDIEGQGIRKTLTTHRDAEACTITYENLGADPVQLTLRPLVCHKFYHDNFRVADFYPEFLVFPDDRTLLSHQGVVLSLEHPGAERTPATGWYYRFEHIREHERGLDGIDDLFCPCELRYVLAAGEKVSLVAATQEGVAPEDAAPESKSDSLRDKLEQSAGLFLVKTEQRSSIIAGYPWFTDWGRDTMIALPGICLATGRYAMARDILASYASQMRQGLIPNRFVEQGETPEYNTVDATLWFANAIYLTLKADWDEAFAGLSLGWLRDILKWHLAGTRYGIAVDPADGLVTQGEPGVQLTWMDAKVKDWVVTPRHGKPVEINGLWINFLRASQWVAERLAQDGSAFVEAAQSAEANFEAKFWHEGRGHYLDTVDPADASLRPNQVLALALEFTACDPEHAKRALAKCREKLLVPVGLRTLAPDEAGYQGRFEGPMAQRDAAYHQGTAWPWLLGSYATATVKWTGDKEHARQALARVEPMLKEYGLGGIAEVYDGDAPHRPGGCPWQAWSTGELLRAIAQDEL